jgi:hypothetical protein
MPTILLIDGWRFYFYSNENKEPFHIHCRKAEKEGKYWLNDKSFDVKEAFTYAMSSVDKRIVRKILFENFEYFKKEWERFERKK